MAGLKRNNWQGSAALAKSIPPILQQLCGRSRMKLLHIMGSDKRKDNMGGDISWIFCKDNHEYLSRHPEIERFDMPKTFYFRYLPDRLKIHWAIIVPKCGGYRPPVYVYFINDWGRVFDKLEFKNVKIARRRLRRNGFDFSTNKYCPYMPPEPIYIKLSEGKKSAPYSKGNLFQSVQRDRKFPDKTRNSYEKGWATIENNQKKWEKEKKPQEYTTFGVTGDIGVMIGIVILILLCRPVFWLSLRNFIKYIKTHFGG